jgi:urease accessory protein
MPRAIRVVSAAARDGAPAADTLILPLAGRRMRQGVHLGLGGTAVEFDFPSHVCLRTDDALVLDDGALVEVVAEAEPLIEVRAADAVALARLAWHLGSTHAEVQIFERRLRMQRTPAVEGLLDSLGVKGVAIEAPFEPEGGDVMPAHGHHNHGHGHDHHHHEHPHHGAHHEHGPDCGHDHAHDKRR